MFIDTYPPRVLWKVASDRYVAECFGGTDDALKSVEGKFVAESPLQFGDTVQLQKFIPVISGLGVIDGFEKRGAVLWYSFRSKGAIERITPPEDETLTPEGEAALNDVIGMVRTFIQKGRGGRGRIRKLIDAINHVFRKL
jgi:hypothetical protein